MLGVDAFWVWSLEQVENQQVSLQTKKTDLQYSCNLQALDYFGADSFFPDCLEYPENCKKDLGGKPFFRKKFTACFLRICMLLT